MQKIGQSTDTANADDEFTEGSAAGGIAATLLRAAWLNTIQRELAAVVEGAGLGLDATNDAQLLAAIQKLSTLPASGAATGTFTKVTINAKGLVTEGSALTAADVPALPWSKISTGKPTTLAGYGITDALAAAGTAVAAAKLATARTLTFSGGATGSASFDGSANVAIALTLKALTAADIPALDWSKINSGKPTTLAGYGITDALAATGNAVSASKWATPRTITLSGSASGSVSIDGSANVSLPVNIPAASEGAAGLVQLATPAQTISGTSSTTAVHPVGLAASLAQMPIANYYETTVAWTAGGTLTITHNLGVVPKLVTFEVVATAAANGLAVGETAELGGQNISTSNAQAFGAEARKKTAATVTVVVGVSGIATWAAAGNANSVSNTQTQLKVKVFA